jgi:hypothetical protein
MPQRLTRGSFMRHPRSTLRDSLFGWLTARPSPVDARRQEARIRERMLEELLHETVAGCGWLATRIHEAADVEALWYQRTSLMQALSRTQGEAHAAHVLAEITQMFEGSLPRSMVCPTSGAALRRRSANDSAWQSLTAKILGFIAATGMAALSLTPQSASALPLFARQTGQNCVACHAGGQFPELTPYGRMFKLTGYTLGERPTVPLAAMAVITHSRVADTAKSDDPGADFQKNGKTILATASVFLGGKISDNLGAFVQLTHDPYAVQNADGSFSGHSGADNIELRYADRFVGPQRDLIFGLSLNNNPSMADPWNTAPAWMQYVPVPSPTSSRFIDGTAPYPGYAAGGNLAGITAYAYWNRTFYAELGAYGTSRGALRFMSAGIPNEEVTKLRGLNPYWRLAWTREWGAHNLMIGTSGMTARIYDDPGDTSDTATLHRTRDLTFDAQYQYLLDPHSVTVQFVHQRSRHRFPGSLANQPVAFVDAAGNPVSDTNEQDTARLTRAKFTYVYSARYGGSLGVFNLTGSTNTANQSSGFSPDTLAVTSDPLAAAPSTRVSGNFSGNPATRGLTLEAFWMPVQYVRVGAQYTAYSRFNGASQNYDGFGRNARDNNSLFLYLWAAY